MYNKFQHVLKTYVLMSAIVTFIACINFGFLSNYANAEHDKNLYGSIVDGSYPEPLIGKIYVGHSIYTTDSKHKYPVEMFINIEKTERYLALFDQSGQNLIVIKQLTNDGWENIWISERLQKESRHNSDNKSN